MPSALHHTGLIVEDLDRSIEFYRSTFGMRPVCRVQLGGDAYAAAEGVDDAQVEIAMLVGRNMVLELIQHVGPRGRGFDLANDDVGAAHRFVTDDLDGDYERLRAVGVPFFSAPSEPVSSGPDAGTRFVYLRAPAGITVELMQPGDGLLHEALGIDAER